jgi:predicted aminopeptidase
VIFHELAHQRLYVKDDTAFNESFASFVQEEGLREWRASRGLPLAGSHDDGFDRAFTGWVLDLRERLRAVYARPIAPDAMREQRQHEIAVFRDRFAALRDQHWKGDTRYDRWVAAPINNASLLPFGLYDRWMSAFAGLFEREGRRWPDFYAEVAQLARLPKVPRECKLAAMTIETGSGDMRSSSCPE